MDTPATQPAVNPGKALKEITRLLNTTRPLRWLFTGDSISHGSVHTWGERDYVQLFEERLRMELDRHRDHVICTAISGRTIHDVEDDFDWSITQYRADVVSLMFGLNDCATAEPDIPAFIDSYLRVIDLATAGGAAVIVHTPNRMLATETAEWKANLPSFVGAIRNIASKRDVLLIDHYAAWETAENSGQIQYWIDHGCHPNTAGHRVLARTLLEKLGAWDPNSATGRLFIPAPETLDTPIES